MTAPGAKAHDATGRSTGKRKGNKRTKISGQFRTRTVAMLESPAFRVLSLSEHRILARLEIELSRHGGADNGKLPCTFDDFQEYGIHRDSIAPAIRALAALGFLEITERGRAGNSVWRRPHVYRLTYQNTDKSGPTDEWSRVETIAQAKKIASAARKSVAEKTNLQSRNPDHSLVRKPDRSSPFHSPETVTTGHSPETVTTLDISEGGRT